MLAAAPDIIRTRTDTTDFTFVDNVFAGLPEHFKQSAARRYCNEYRQKGAALADDWLTGVSQSVTVAGAALAGSDEALCAFAALRAATVSGMLADMVGTTAAALEKKLAGYCTRYGIAAPVGVDLRGLIARLTDAGYWRRQLRRTVARQIEGAAIGLGLVHRRAGLYASDETVARHAEQMARNAAALENTEAVCTVEVLNERTGKTEKKEQTFSLAELASKGLSNPAIRFAELMVRVRGMEEHAIAAKHVGLFITGTAPSPMHARIKATCRQNELFDGTVPREAQQWIGRQWSRIRAVLARLNIRYYGVRVAEPHHDGTPHWHMLIFVQPELEAARWHAPLIYPHRSAVGRLQAVFRRYLLRGDWKASVKKDIVENLRGEGMTARTATAAAALAIHYEKVLQRRAEKDDTARRAHCCDFKTIEATEGSAAGYIVKYLAKNISGERVGAPVTDEQKRAAESNRPALETAARVLAWASCWGIRQFQVIGGPPVGVWRQLRRIEEKPEQLELFAAWSATGQKETKTAPAVAPDWAAYIAAQGGIAIRQDERPVALWKLAEPGRRTKYLDEAPARVAGVVCAGVCTATRPHLWTLRRVEAKDGRAAKDAAALKRSAVRVWGSGLPVAVDLAPQAPRTRTRTRGFNCTERTEGIVLNMAAHYAAGNKEAVLQIFNELRILKHGQGYARSKAGMAKRPAPYQDNGRRLRRADSVGA